jgi:hypothetical protein
MPQGSSGVMIPCDFGRISLLFDRNIIGRHHALANKLSRKLQHSGGEVQDSSMMQWQEGRALRGSRERSGIIRQQRRAHSTHGLPLKMRRAQSRNDQGGGKQGRQALEDVQSKKRRKLVLSI